MYSARKIWTILNQIIERIIFGRNLIMLGEKGKLSSKAVYRGTRILGNVIVGEGCKIQNGVSIKTSSFIKIDRYTSINGPNTDLFSQIYPIEIGSFCSIARNVTIQEFNHKHTTISTYAIRQNIFKEPKKNDIYSNGSIVIENDVWIGAQCVILSGAIIRNGAIIAANSVVNKEIPPYAIAAGSPARVIGYRFREDIIEQLLSIQWWNWTIDKIKRNRQLFIENINLEILTDLSQAKDFDL